MKIFAIAVISKYCEEDIEKDEIRIRSLGFKGIRIIIPVVRLLKSVVYNKESYHYKPLLFRYGFMEMDETFGQDLDKLNLIKDLCISIQGFMLRKRNDLKQEMLQNIAKVERIKDKLGTDEIKVASEPQIRVETVSSDEVSRLIELAKDMSVYDSEGELEPGAFVILRGYPFANMLAQIDQISGNSIKVTLIDTGFKVTVQKCNVYYTPYEDKGNREICFTELGYVPNV
jgi:transcription antitermination factor NusG